MVLKRKWTPRSNVTMIRCFLPTLPTPRKTANLTRFSGILCKSRNFPLNLCHCGLFVQMSGQAVRLYCCYFVVPVFLVLRVLERRVVYVTLMCRGPTALIFNSNWTGDIFWSRSVWEICLWCLAGYQSLSPVSCPVSLVTDKWCLCQPSLSLLSLSAASTLTIRRYHP